MRRLKKLAVALGIALAAVLAVGAYGWFVQPALLVVPLRQAGYWSLGVQSRTVQAEGVEWPYLEAGAPDAPPILLLHGFGTSKDAMMMMMPAMAKAGFRVLAPDLPGFGAHPFHDGKDHTPQFYTAQIVNFLDAVHAPQVVVIGTSMGGALSAELALEHPERVRALAMLSPAGVEPPVHNAFMQRVDSGQNPLDIATAGDFDNVVQLVFLRPPPVPHPYRTWMVEQALERRPQTLAIVESLRPFLRDGLRGRMSQVKCPTLVLYGQQDAVTDPSMLQVFQAEMPTATAVTVPDAGHVAFSDNWPGVWSHLQPFLAGLQ